MTRFRAGLLLAFGLCAPAASPAQVAAPAAPRTIASAPDRFFTRGEARFRYREAGRGAPVVLLHGYTQRIELMEDLADSLSGSFRVIVFDERGFGESSKFSDPARYGQAMVEDVIGLLDQLKIRRAHLVGHSMGALVAAQVALRYPAPSRTGQRILGGVEITNAHRAGYEGRSGIGGRGGRPGRTGRVLTVGGASSCKNQQQDPQRGLFGLPDSVHHGSPPAGWVLG